MAYPLTDVLADPQRAARDLEHDGIVYGVRAACGRTTEHGAAVLEMTLEPQPGLRAEGYLPERIRIVVLRDERAFTYVLSGRGRNFKHRNPAPSRSLCLFYDEDVPDLRWRPEDGLGEFVTIVRRHLVFEEFWRRTGRWPCEDAPHGPAIGGVHPIITAETRAIARRWARSVA